MTANLFCVLSSYVLSLFCVSALDNEMNHRINDCVYMTFLFKLWLLK